MSKVLFSIITVVYNSVNTIEDTILSVINQNFQNYEYIIIDGGSTDGSFEIVEKYQNKIDFVISEPDSGIYDAMNKGSDLARGKYLLFLNSGDYLTNIFANSVKEGIIYNLLYQTDIKYDVIFGDAILIDIDKKSKYKKAESLNRLCYKIPFCHQSTLVLKSEFINLKFDTNYKISADFKLFRQFYFNNKKFIYTPIPFVLYNLDGISSNNPIKLLKEYKNIIKEHKINLYNSVSIAITNIKLLKHEISAWRK